MFEIESKICAADTDVPFPGIVPITRIRLSSKRIAPLGQNEGFAGTGVQTPAGTIENTQGLPPHAAVEPDGVEMVTACGPGRASAAIVT
jgi:hypothetical protein